MADSPVRILLVDDEPALLRLMQTFLTRLGYIVEACPDSKSALAAFERAPDQFDVLVTDLTLAGISGEDLGMQMAAANPTLCVLLCSGYDFPLNTLPEGLRHRFASLQKPFVPNLLVAAIEKLLRKNR
jgi:DNA-binding NtrC family response regulator